MEETLTQNDTILKKNTTSKHSVPQRMPEMQSYGHFATKQSPLSTGSIYGFYNNPPQQPP